MLLVSFNIVTKLKQLLYLRGYITSDKPAKFERLNARIIGPAIFTTTVSTFKATVNSERNIGFEVFALSDSLLDLRSIRLQLGVDVNGQTELIDYDYAKISSATMLGKFTVMNTWKDLLAKGKVKRILDIGGRARSGKSMKSAYLGVEVIVADIIPAPDVDLVADVHELSKHARQPFDGFMAIATFEHLIMPWKAAIEINKVLTIGAPGLVVTHQTVGMHERPWDFFRYSDMAWKGIFNSFTGFEIVDAGMRRPAMIIPHVWDKENDGAENAVGYLTSSVVVRKIGEPMVDWNVSVGDITADMYPLQNTVTGASL